MTNTPAVYTAIAAVQGELAKIGISKDGVNESQKYKFRGIDQVYGALSPLLAKHGLCVLPRIIGREMHERVTIKEWQGQKKESVLFYVTVEAEFDFVAVSDGSKHTVRTYGEAMDSGDKATNKAMSAAYKYAAFMAFAIPTEGDNDADATTHEVQATSGPAPRTKLEGPHGSKTALKAAIAAIDTKIRAAAAVTEINAALKAGKDTIAQAETVWPELIHGDPAIEEAEGLQGLVVRRRAELSAADDGMFAMLLKSMRENDTLGSLTRWLATNESLVDELDDIERRKFEKELDAFEGGLKLVATAAA